MTPTWPGSKHTPSDYYPTGRPVHLQRIAEWLIAEAKWHADKLDAGWADTITKLAREERRADGLEAELERLKATSQLPEEAWTTCPKCGCDESFSGNADGFWVCDACHAVAAPQEYDMILSRMKRAEAARDRVEALHQSGSECGFRDCDDCGLGGDCEACGESWPCPTVAAVRGGAA